jgi:hypothetical protein
MIEYNKIIRKTFQEISKAVYELLEVANPEIRQVNEDGISSIILKKMYKLHNHGIYVKTKSLKVNEATTGVDFDLWIGENDKKYVRFVIQAKSFGNNTSPSQSYNIDYDQCRKLIAHSKQKHEAFPLYFFYQYIKDENLASKHFSFVEDFQHEYSSITVSSAYSIEKLITKGSVTFADIHRNQITKEWKNDIFSLIEGKKEDIGLPFYLLHDAYPSKIEKFQKLISTKNNSLGFFFFFFEEEHPFKLHEINAKEIENLYGNKAFENQIQFKNLVIVNRKQN